jgi:hypothetical protein
MRNTYIVQYIAFGDGNRILKEGKMRCKNRLSEFDAQAGLDDFFKKKLSGFRKLKVISVKIESSADFLESIFSNLFQPSK